MTAALAVANALKDLHARWISHGDVKPDNILICPNGRLSIGDPLGNGLGCTFRLATNCGGTPGYWAPEVAAGGGISRAGGGYSLGRTLYPLATGRLPAAEVGSDFIPHASRPPVEIRHL